ncbi:conserved hypothetical protein [Candidatus Desulfarcum epimagneticum]|uniref:Outer membrane efflux protein n=1 Tax=uncultured Desulfobacteraceae bacterium TaxID=218296 RepID=A0A484HDE2_9BACT|nr:conserved hypothetical protein [uncultured Desulfobacteraceae bacterium]
MMIRHIGRKMKKNIAAAVWFSCALVFGGCAVSYRLDMEAGRLSAIENDAFLKNVKKYEAFKKPLTLEDAMRIALENNLEIRVRGIMEEISDGDAVSAKLKMLPRGDFSAGSSSRSDYDISDSKDLDTGQVTVSNVISEPRDVNTREFSLSWNILDFGLSYIRARQAAVNSEIRRMERKRQGQLLAMNVRAAYWKSVMAEKNLEKIPKIEKILKENKAAVEKLVAARQADPSRLKEAEKTLVSLALTASSLQAEASGARIELANLMGVGPGADFYLAAADDLAFIAQMPDPKKLKAPEMEIMSLRNRPELFVSDLSIQIQRDEARAALTDMFPGIRFNASSHYDSNPYLHHSSWHSIGANVAMNILSLPFKAMKLKGENMKTRLAETRRSLLTAGIVAQVHMALHRFGMAREQFNLYEQYHRIHKDLSEMGRARRQAGMLSAADMARRVMEEMVAGLKRDKAFGALADAHGALMATLGVNYDQWSEIFADKKGPDSASLALGAAGIPAPLGKPDLLIGRRLRLYDIVVRIKKHRMPAGEPPRYIHYVLGQVCKIPADLVFDEFIDLFRRLNPGMSGDLIRGGEEALFPFRVDQPGRE